ncbi:G-protein coupled receptor 83-like [Oculina patagonica]
MSLRNNTTIPVIPNETALAQQNSPCVFVHSNAEKISILCAYSFIFLGSFFGNTFIIIIVYKHRDLRKTIHYFIVNMAVSDLVLSMMIIPVQITDLVTDSWHWHVSGILGSFFCKFIHFAGPVTLRISAQSLMWIAIDRFVAVIFPIKRGLISTKFLRRVLVSTWIFAGLFNFPSLITGGLVKRGKNSYCESVNIKPIFPSQEAFNAYLVLQRTLFTTLVLLTVLYTAIAIALKKQNKALADTAPIAQRHSLKKRRKAIQMAVVIVVLFYICIIAFTLHPILQWRLSCAFQKLYNFLAFFTMLLSTTVNPLICLLFVESYRRGLRNILCACRRRRNTKVAKREQIILKGIKHIPEEN